jgi:NAD(P)-dependent dehydrogenase (short-subunit alcohol dehydrogenase family)
MGDVDDFRDRAVLIDGADTPLGAAVACYLASKGARLSLLGDDVEHLRAAGGGLGSAVRDQRVVSDHDDVGELVASVISDAGHLDAAFSARGSVIRGWDASEKPAAVSDTVERDLIRVMLSTRALVDYFVSRECGRIVTTAVAAGSFGLKGAATFSAISGAIAGLTRSHALSLGRSNVKLNAVAPILNAAAGGGIVNESTVFDEERYGAEVVAPVVGYLASEQCGVTGQIFSVGGGRTARTFNGTVAGFFDAEAEHGAIGSHLAEILATDHPIMLEDSRDELLLIEV